MGRESPCFITDGVPNSGLNDLCLGSQIGFQPMVYPFWSTRFSNLTGMGPMMSLNHPGVSNMSPAYLQDKVPFGGLLSNYMVSGGAFPIQPGMFLPGGMAPSTSLNYAGVKPSPENESLDLRKSSIDTLRLKAKEHSATLGDKMMFNSAHPHDNAE